MNEDLIQAAKGVRSKAHAPYSSYPVGAAILDEQGQIHAGCNVENVSFPVGSCAERNAIAKMVAEGGRQIQAVAVVTRDGGTPCGMCLQALLEFAQDPGQVQVITLDEGGSQKQFTLRDLIPHGFSSKL